MKKPQYIPGPECYVSAPGIAQPMGNHPNCGVIAIVMRIK